MKKRYIAYGSNMNIEQMKMRCPTACILGTSELEGYTLVFRGNDGGAVATVEKKSGASVPVVVWEIGEQDERNLDIYEGFPRLYYKENFSIYLKSRKVGVFAYIMSYGYKVAMPSEYYFNVILEGYSVNDIDTKPLFNALFEVRNSAG